MRKRYAAAIIVMSMLMLVICADCNGDNDSLRFVIGSDLHYIAPELTDGGPFFRELLAHGDGKTSSFCEELTDAFLEDVCREKPDALVLTGDLSFNGALESHRALAEKLRRVEAAGIPVLVLTGNHDVFCDSAARFEGENYTLVKSATTDDFRKIYAEFGYDEAMSRDSDSLSYCYELSDRCRVLMLDANTAAYSCAFSQTTLGWIEAQLKAAADHGTEIIAACHQNLLQHSMFSYGYVLEQSQELQRLFEKYGVSLFLSGHLHMQHAMEQSGVTEIVTSALCSYPCQYGVLCWNNGSFRYETCATDVYGWAQRHGRDVEVLLSFQDYAAALFDRRTLSQTVPILLANDLTDEERAAMNAYACEVNRAYFSGHMERYEELDPKGELRELWESTQSLYGYYLNSIRDDAGKNYNEWTVE